MSTTPPAPDAQPEQHPAPQAPTGPVTAYLPQGGFARAVAARLAGPDDVVIPVDNGLVSAYVPYADRAVLVADPDQTGLREDLDALSFTRGMPSLGLEQAYARHHVLLGAGLISLALQTLDRPEAAGTDDAEAGGVDAVKSSAEPAELPQIGGQVWTIDLVSGVTACSRTVAVDRCETCSGRYEGRRDGLPALAALLPERREEVA